MSVAVCPGCGARYRVPDNAAGKRTTCKRCGQSFRIPEAVAVSAPPPVGAPPAPPAGTGGAGLIDLESLAAGQAMAPPIHAAPPATPSAAPVAPWPPAGGPNAGEMGTASDSSSYRDYLLDIGRSLLLFRGAGNLATFLVIWLIVVVSKYLLLLAFACLPLLAALVLLGWYIAYQLNVVLAAAGGEEDLPAPAFISGWVDDIIIPFVRMLGSRLLARLPAAVLLAGAAMHYGAGFGDLFGPILWFVFGNYDLLLRLPDGPVQVVAGLVLVFGLFLWPMFVLIVAAGSLFDLRRLDLILETVVRAFPAYLIAAVVVWVSTGAGLVSSALLTAAGLSGMRVGHVNWSMMLMLPLGLALIEVYTTLVAMRTIGLFYHHFKHKFAWSWG